MGVRSSAWIRLWASIGFLMVATFGCAGPSESSDLDSVRTELRELIEDVVGSTAHRYQLRDTDGRDMGAMTVIWSPEAQRFAAIYHTWEEPFGAFVVHLATSDDLFTWEEQNTYDVGASQPTMARTPSGRYVLAWEQEPDPIHLVLLEFSTWADLVAKQGTPRVLEPAVTMPACGEGTADITSASDELVEVTFHYHAGCERDRQAHGWTDWTEWHAAPDHHLDALMETAGVHGHIGDRTSFTYRGRPFMLIDGETVPGDWASWQTFLYDVSAGAVEPLEIRTDGGSRAFSNPSVEIVTIDGQQSLLVTLNLFTEGAADGEGGSLLYYQTLPHEPGP